VKVDGLSTYVLLSLTQNTNNISNKDDFSVICKKALCNFSFSKDLYFLIEVYVGRLEGALNLPINKKNTLQRINAQ